MLAALLLVPGFLAGCSAGGGDVAATGGMSGTGISQGTIDSFGSIFVNAVQWSLVGATIVIDGQPASEAGLRVGMVVRVEGDFDAGGQSGNAIRVVFDDAIEGPIEAPPVETVPGVEKRFTILGQDVFVFATGTVFDDGASFAGLAAGQRLEVSGFVDETGAIEATRVSLTGAFPGDDEVELRGTVANLVVGPGGDGIFDLGTVVVRFGAATVFDDVTPATLMNGDLVEVEGTLRVSGTEVDATTIEREDEGLGVEDAERVELEGIVELCAAAPDFCVDDVPVDASGATFVPMGFVPVPGDLVEVEGSLVAGILQAERVESEEEDDEEGAEVEIEAEVTSVDAVARTLVILGVTIVADGQTVLVDESAVGDESLTFGEISPGDFLVIEAVESGPGEALAESIVREDAMAGDDEVVLLGPVTAFSAAPSLEILGQSVPLDGMTLYFDENGMARTATQFFDSPGDVALGSIVGVTDEDAADLAVLGEADEVELEVP